MQCEFCGAETKKKNVIRQHWVQGRLYIVEDVEAEVCAECGERYFHAKTLDAVDALLARQHAVKETLCVEVVQFAKEKSWQTQPENSNTCNS
jgi:YgiT-type zinc finger domain-containing protein